MRDWYPWLKSLWRDPYAELRKGIPRHRVVVESPSEGYVKPSYDDLAERQVHYDVDRQTGNGAAVISVTIEAPSDRYSLFGLGWWKLDAGGIPSTANETGYLFAAGLNDVIGTHPLCSIFWDVDDLILSQPIIGQYLPVARVMAQTHAAGTLNFEYGIAGWWIRNR